MPLVEIRNLNVTFKTARGVLHAVEGIDLTMEEGELLGIVGESGSGKSVTMLALMGLIAWPGKVTADRLAFAGQNILALSAAQRRRIIGKDIAMIFQEPMTSLNPCFTVGFQIMETLREHEGGTRAGRRRRAIELLEQVGIPEPATRLNAFPHQLSGGMSQRVMIAMAISCNPRLLIADEPTTALDVTIQAQILEYFKELRTRLGMALLLITHDLGIVAGTTSRVIVMYAGHIVETGPTAQVLATPLHPYTEGLKRSIPRLDRPRAERLEPIEGSPPDPNRPLPGCPFKPRCPKRIDRCDTAPRLSPAGPAREVACWVVSESAAGAR